MLPLFVVAGGEIADSVLSAYCFPCAVPTRQFSHTAKYDCKRETRSTEYRRGTWHFWKEGRRGDRSHLPPFGDAIRTPCYL
ncbi:hypothetical protein HDV62DRAFT_77735 [Trichoderma sp. SZMC 28011]